MVEPYNLKNHNMPEQSCSTKHRVPLDYSMFKMPDYLKHLEKDTEISKLKDMSLQTLS